MHYAILGCKYIRSSYVNTYTTTQYNNSISITLPDFCEKLVMRDCSIKLLPMGVCRICQLGGPNFLSLGLLGKFGGMLPREIFLNSAIWCVLEYVLIKFWLKTDQLHSLKKLYFVWKRHISWINKAATLPVEPFGTQSFSKCQHVGGGGIPLFYIKTDWRDDLVKNPKLNPNNHYHW